MKLTKANLRDKLMLGRIEQASILSSYSAGRRSKVYGFEGTIQRNAIHTTQTNILMKKTHVSATPPLHASSAN